MKAKYSIVWGYLALVLIGTALFLLPWSVPAGQLRLTVGEALFTATSAVCITGLTVIDPGTALSPFGQGVLLLLVQIGCVGIITLGTFLLVCTGRRLSLSNEFSLSDAYGAKGVVGIRGLIVWVVLSMIAFEAAGAAALVGLRDLSWPQAFFYASMAFCNAGFSLAPDSVACFSSAPSVLCVMAVLTMCGGFGFLVLYNLLTIRWWRRNLVTRGRPSLHSRAVLYASLALVAFGTLFFALVEWNGALAPLGGWTDRLVGAFYQSVTARTCGFTVVPQESFSSVSNFMTEILMFVGAGPGGAGGGVKVTTVLVVVMVVAAIYRGRREVILSKRTIGDDVVREAILIVFLYAAMVALAMVALLFTETCDRDLPFENLLFETVSAVTTTGLSIGDTTLLLSPAGRAVIMLCMFFGRLGALTLVLLVADRDEPQSIHYPHEELVVG